MNETGAVVSVTQMAKMVGLSRARFYQLQRAGIFPTPLKDEASGRPFYSEELQRTCLEVRKRNCGVNGKPILFYARRHEQAPAITPAPTAKRERKNAAPKDDQREKVVEAIRSLGLTSVTAAQVDAAKKELGLAGNVDFDALKAIFLHLRAQGLGR